MRFIAALVLFVVSACAQQYRAIWADAFNPGFKSPGEADQLIEHAAATRSNALFVQMRRRGDTYFRRSIEPPAADPDYSPSFDALEYLVRRAHERNIEVHAWVVVGPAWRDRLGAPPDARHVWNRHGPSASGDSMWLTVNDRGETAMRLNGSAEASYSLDLGHPDAARYLAEVILEPLKNYDIDGIHLDYIRYPEYPGDWGRNPVSLARFQRLHNRAGAPDTGDPQWEQFRRDQVTALMRQIYVRAHALKPRVKVSAALITWGDGPATPDAFPKTPAYNRAFQDWPAWLAEGILDLAIPMNYFREATHAASLDRWLEFEKDHQYSRAVVPGLGVYLNSPEQAMAQVKRALSPSAAGNRPAGVNLYNYASSAVLSKRAAEELGDPGGVPGLPWLERPDTGTAHGWLSVSSGPAWLIDGADVWFESTTMQRIVRAISDGTGFFAAVGLPPDTYRVRVSRGGREVFRTAPRAIAAGESALFHFFLTASDFDAALPRILRARSSSGALVIEGTALAGYPEPGEVLVLIDGAPAPVAAASQGRIECSVAARAGASIVVRRAGMDSVPFIFGGNP